MSFKRQMLEYETYLTPITLKHLPQRLLHRLAIRALEVRELNDRYCCFSSALRRRDAIIQLRHKPRRREVHPDGPLLSQRIERGTVMLHAFLIFEIETQPLARFVGTHRRKERSILHKRVLHLRSRYNDLAVCKLPSQLFNRNIARRSLALQNFRDYEILECRLPDRVKLLLQRIDSLRD